jgi:hypothetical protein
MARVSSAVQEVEAAVMAFALSNGVFVRVFPMAPSSATYISVGFLVLGSSVVARSLGFAALAIGAAFEVGGVVAIFTGAAVIVIGVLAAAQSIWVVAAAVCLWRTAR